MPYSTLEDQIMTQTRSLLTDYHTMNAREAKSILDMELATIRDAMAARFAKLHGDLGARVDSVDADVERLQLSVEHQAAMLEERLVSERRDAERRAESHANVVDRSLRDGIATFEKSLDGKVGVCTTLYANAGSKTNPVLAHLAVYQPSNDY